MSEAIQETIQWNRVEDKLPPSGNDVLIVRTGKSGKKFKWTSVAFYQEGSGWFRQDGCQIKRSPVAFWAEMPKGPIS